MLQKLWILVEEKINQQFYLSGNAEIYSKKKNAVVKNTPTGELWQ